VTLWLVPAIFAMGYQPEVASGSSFILEMGRQMKWAFIGLAVALMALGVVIGSFIARARPIPPAVTSGPR